MNVDFMLPATPAAARKLIQASGIMKLNLDEGAHELAKQDLLTREQVIENLPGNLAMVFPYDDMIPERTNSLIKVCQYVADHNYRCMIATREVREAMIYSLIAACATGDQVLIASEHEGTQSSTWLEILNAYDVPYQHLKKLDDQVDPTQRVVIAELTAIGENVFKNQRHRVCVDVCLTTSRSTSTNSLFAHAFTFGTGYQLGSNRKEFTKIIGAFAQPLRSRAWWEDSVALTAASQMFDDMHLFNLFAFQAHMMQEYKNMGFTNANGNEISEFLGINVEYMK